MRRIWRRYLPQDASVNLSKDGRRIVTSVGLEGDALVFDAATGDRIASLEGTWSSARISPDSRWVVVEELPTDPFGQTIGRIHLYDLETGSHARSFEAPIRGFYGPIFSGFVWGSDSKTIASCVDSRVYIWDVETARIIYEGIRTQTQGVPCDVVYSPDGSLAAVGSGEGLVIVSLQGGETILDEAITVYSTTWIGSHLITADGQSISVFDGPTGTLIQRMDNAAIQVDASPDGTSLLARNKKSIAVYEPDLTLRFENPLNNEQVTWSSDGAWLTSYAVRPDPNSQGREQRQLAQYTVTSALNGQVQCRAPETVGVQMLPGGRMVVLSSGLFFVMESCSSQLIVSARTKIPVNRLGWSDDERELRIDGPDGAWYWNEASSLVAQTSSAAFNSVPVEVNPDKPSYRGGKLTSPDGSTTISVLFDTACGDGPFGGGCGTWGSTIQIFKTGEDEPAFVLEDTHTGVTSLVWSPDGKTLASGHGGQYSDLQGGRIDLIDVSTGTVIKTFEGHLSDVVALYFSPSGRRLVSVSMDGTLIVWNTAQ
jgi:WD40 repeat protein